MNVLIVGNGKSCSFAIRGYQIGKAIGARAVGSKAEERADDFAWANVVVAVKRPREKTLAGITDWHLFIHDIVDCWPQPVGNTWTREQALDWLHGELRRLKPDAVVFPTRQMQADAEFSGPSIVLPHHAWPKYRPHKPSGPVVVGYEGADYLGSWRKRVVKQCEARGWHFTENGNMQRADIGIALRSASGYPARAWKSGCKLANLQALGIPAICSPEAGYRETGSGAELFVETAAELSDAFDVLADPGRRREIGKAMVKAAPRLADVAAQYRGWLRSI